MRLDGSAHSEANRRRATMSRTIASSIPAVLERCTPVRLATKSLPRWGWTTARTVPNDEPPTIAWPDVLRDAGEPSSIEAVVAAHATARCFIVGEQHHQPRVLLAQLAVLDALSRRPSTLHVVLEMFNVLQADMLERFGASYRDGEAKEDEAAAGERLVSDYDTDGSETFQLEHYLPLLYLARSRGVKLHGGFPPRRWARTVSKEGVDAAKRQAADEGYPAFDRWEDLRTSPEHQAYIRSLIRGQPPVVEPAKPDQPIGGLPAAQASKDAVCAFVVDGILADPSATVLVITGSGHVEYGYAIVERVRSVERSQQCVIVAAAEDQPVWRGERWGEALSGTDGRAIADAVFLYDAIDA